MKFIVDISTTLVAHLFNFAAGLAASIVIARALGPAGQGIYALVIVFPLLITTFTNLGVARAIIALAGRGGISRQELYGNIFSLALLISLLALLAGAFAIIFFRHGILPGVPRTLALFSLAIIPCQLFFYQIFKAILLVELRVYWFNLILLIKGLALVGSAVLLLPGLKLGIGGAIAANLLATGIACLLSGFIVFGRLRIPFSLKLSGPTLKPLIWFGIKSHLNNILTSLQFKLDIFLLNIFLNPLVVGHYTIATFVGEKLWVFSQTTSTLLFPRLVAMRGEAAKAEFISVLCRINLILAAGGGIFLYGLAPWLLDFFYGVDYLPAARPLRILIAGLIAVSVSRILFIDLDARHKPMLNTYVSAFALGVNLLLNLLLIPRYGLEGAAMASTLSYMLGAIAQVRLYCRVTGNPAARLLLPGKKDLELLARLLSRGRPG